MIGHETACSVMQNRVTLLWTLHTPRESLARTTLDYEHQGKEISGSGINVIQAYCCLYFESSLCSLQQHSALARSVMCSFHCNHPLNHDLNFEQYCASYFHHLQNIVVRDTSGYEKELLSISVRAALQRLLHRLLHKKLCAILGMVYSRLTLVIYLLVGLPADYSADRAFL